MAEVLDLNSFETYVVPILRYWRYPDEQLDEIRETVCWEEDSLPVVDVSSLLGDERVLNLLVYIGHTVEGGN